MTTSTVTERSTIANGLTVSEVSATSGVNPSAVRFYDKHGVI